MAADAAGNRMTLSSGCHAIVASSGVIGTRGGRRQMWNVFGDRMAGSNVGHADI